jgi:ppGpp synthetase/RelA/SpoT-type nucleotidyltranferase
MGLRKRAAKVEAKPLVAQRLKRFSSVMSKLVREPQMKLSQMQDLGGCRAILSDVKGVYRLYERYRGSRDLFMHEGQLKCYDYIQEPKPDGYRGIHVVGRYSARDTAHESWNGARIEVQLRSRLQHAFATAVETVTTFTRTPLKFGGGPDDWRRFFALMGSALALREGTALVCDTPGDTKELIDELRETTKTLKVRSRLRGWTTALQKLRSKNIKGFRWLLLVLDTSANTISATGYPSRQEAAQALAQIEQSQKEELDAVLVWVNSIRDLQAAYPNYYADTGEFINALSAALGT